MKGMPFMRICKFLYFSVQKPATLLFIHTCYSKNPRVHQEEKNHNII